MKPYVLRSSTIDQTFSIRLEQDEFKKLNEARLSLLAFIEMEELVIQCLSSIHEFEKFALNEALEEHISPLREDFTVRAVRVNANTKVMGFLISITSLRDQFPKLTIENRCLRAVFMEKWSEEKSKSVPFAFCERLRNYAQHQSQPISRTVSNHSWDPERIYGEVRVGFYADVDAVCKNRSISSDEKANYVSIIGTRADVSLICRSAVSSICKVVKEVRAFSQEHFEGSVKIYRAALDQIGSVKSGMLAGVLEGGDAGPLDIFEDYLDRACRLRRTFLHTNFESHFVSSRPFGHKP